MIIKYIFIIGIIVSLTNNSRMVAQDSNFIENLPSDWIELQKIDGEFRFVIHCEEYYDPEDDEMSSFSIYSRVELEQEEEIKDNRFFVAFSEGFMVPITSAEKSIGHENQFVIKTSGKYIIFRWVVKGKLAYWNFKGLSYEGYYTPSGYIEKYRTVEEKC